ncbi:MAG: amidoligase family protein [Tepidisphaeraceae bacterium]
MGLVSSLNRSRKIGAEFEGYIILTGGNDPRAAQDALAHALSQNGIPSVARGYSHEPLPAGVKAAVEYDSSIQPEQRYRGIRWAQIEVKTAKLDGIDEWEAVVPPMLDLLRYAGLRVNASCGHHLHLSFDEVNDDPRNVRSLWNLYHRHQDTIFHLVSESRRSNSYCRYLPNESKFLHGANSKRELRRRLQRFDRYNWLNLTNLFEDSPRIELRNHHATLDPIKARAWLNLHLAMFDHAIRRGCQAAPSSLPADRKSFDSLMVTIGMRPNSRVYAQVDPHLRTTAKSLLRTYKKFNPQFFTNSRKSSLASTDRELVAVGEE